MASVDFEFDDREFRQAIELYMEATGKDLADTLNRMAKDVAFRAVKYAPIAPASEVRKYDPKFSGAAKRKTKARSERKYSSRLMYAKAAKRGFRKGGGIREEAEKLFKARSISRGFFKAIFVKLAKDFGKNSANKNLRQGFRASKSKGIKAKVTSLQAVLIGPRIYGDKASEGVAMLELAVKKAINEKLHDMVNFAYERMQKTANKYSGR